MIVYDGKLWTQMVSRSTQVGMSFHTYQWAKCFRKGLPTRHIFPWATTTLPSNRAFLVDKQPTEQEMVADGWNQGLWRRG